MKITGVELRRIAMPLVAPFRTSFGTESARDILLVRVVTPDGEGWGECVAMPEPLYSSEYVDGAIEVLTRFLIPALTALDDVDASAVGPALSPFKGHRMSKAALETAVLDAELRAAGMSLARYLGATQESRRLRRLRGHHGDRAAADRRRRRVPGPGYQRVKLKIEPGWDVEPVRAVRERFGDILLQVDANTAYTLGDARHLAKLDDFDLLLIEQPLAEEDVLGHAELARMLRTPICLDESITSARAAADAIALGACPIVNIKPGRVGGYLEARRVHDVCAAHDVPVWCGGMLETGIGRAANLALAALPGVHPARRHLGSSRYYHQDITEPFVLADGHLAVPDGPGIGVEPIAEILDSVTTSKQWLPNSGG